MKTTSFSLVFAAVFAGLSLLASPAHAAIGRIVNKDLGFYFDLPKKWEAYKTAEDGSGYVIVTPTNRDVDAWIFVSDDEMPLQGDEHIEPFYFDDGMGKKITLGNTRTFSRIIRQRYVTISINGPKGWMKTHKGEIENLAKSLHFIR
jgi:hypothetical protein